VARLFRSLEKERVDAPAHAARWRANVTQSPVRSRIDSSIRRRWSAASFHTQRFLEAEMFARLAMFAVVALALAVGSQAKATPLTYGTYYDEELVNGFCSNATSCRSNFAQLPSDHLVLLKKINCIGWPSQHQGRFA
jgi:hypothetical protein